MPLFIQPSYDGSYSNRAYNHTSTELLLDQLLLGYDTGVWTADEVKTPCEGQLESDCSPEMQ